MLDRIKRFIGHWQDGLLWLPVAIGLLLAATHLLPRADPMAAVDGLGFLQGYAALLFKGVLVTFMAWLCKRTYTRDLSDADEELLQLRAQHDGLWQALVIDRLEWVMWLVLWYVVLSG